MLKQLQKNNNKGFTIIEVMIVLAIAGLIILIVLLAVPSLQRNGRNTGIKNDASAIAGALSTFAADNDGKSPGTGDFFGTTGPTLTIGASGTTSQAEAKIQGGTSVPTPTTAAPTAAIPPGTIRIVKGLDCGGKSSGRAFAIWYSIETSKAAPTSAPWNNKCVDA